MALNKLEYSSRSLWLAFLQFRPSTNCAIQGISKPSLSNPDIFANLSLEVRVLSVANANASELKTLMNCSARAPELASPYVLTGSQKAIRNNKPVDEHSLPSLRNKKGIILID